MGRFLSIWLPYLITDRATRLRAELKATAFVTVAPDRGRMIIKAVNLVAVQQGIAAGMVVADAKAMLPDLTVLQHQEGIEGKLLSKLAEWCLRFTPVAAVDPPDGIVLDISGCAHLWGGEAMYLKDILSKLDNIGFTASAAIADTVGTAWAVARFETENRIVLPGRQLETISPLPPAALRLEASVVERLQKLGLYKISHFINMPRSVLYRRFGQALLNRIDQALGQAIEIPEPVQPAVIYQERLSCLEPIKNRSGIDIALERLLKQLCRQLSKEGKGLRTAIFKSYRIDGNLQQITIGTNRPARSVQHLLKLFEQKLDGIRPGLGIELFVLEAPVVEELSAQQESLWKVLGDSEPNTELFSLLDRIAGKVGSNAVHRYLPAAHFWPERSFKAATPIFEKTDATWRKDRARPIILLPVPEKIEVTVPLPDYPPMLFIYKGKIYKVKKADGPERIEREWWLDKGLQRDYYCVEDETGARYWLFRAGHYHDKNKPEWFIHGFFA